ncbi:hypothetical protein NQX30_07195 [Candidatus Persebacteraceae bacterium Df01]|jgi:ubiquinone biosynthesis protein UbiJ|uniref:SCP2 domain-containing protein n=1 Tax=Candidatus Doriopsillibacter californiensis TaxID=2970740 RepID=A0ABT7QN61_9GAMM|nr:hypothetical protein [Candidatus Persebacteraceae bacterium Df01]
MLIASTLSAVTNARLTMTQRQRLRPHVGRVVALEAGTLRLCFRLNADGCCHPLSSLVEADVTMRWQPAAAGKHFHVAGDAALLRDVGDVLQEALPQWNDLPGGEDGVTAKGLRRAGGVLSRQWAQLAPNAVAVNDFNDQVRQFERRCRKLTQTVATVESAYD